MRFTEFEWKAMGVLLVAIIVARAARTISSSVAKGYTMVISNGVIPQAIQDKLLTKLKTPGN